MVLIKLEEETGNPGSCQGSEDLCWHRHCRAGCWRLTQKTTSHEPPTLLGQAVPQETHPKEEIWAKSPQVQAFSSGRELQEFPRASISRCDPEDSPPTKHPRPSSCAMFILEKIIRFRKPWGCPRPQPDHSCQRGASQEEGEHPAARHTQREGMRSSKCPEPCRTGSSTERTWSHSLPLGPASPSLRLSPAS